MSKVKRFRVMPLILASVIILSLFSACGNDDEEEVQTANEYVYVPEYISVPKEVQDMYNAAYSDGKLYFVSYVTVGKETATDEFTGEEYEYDVNEQRLCSINVDGTGFAQLEGYVKPEPPEGLPDGAEGDYNISRVYTDREGNLWVVEHGSYYHYDLPADFDETTGDQWQYYVDDGSVYGLRMLDKTGAELSKIDLSEIAGQSSSSGDVIGGVSSGPMPVMRGGGEFYIAGMGFDTEGNVYISDGNQTVYVLDSAGALQFKVEDENWIRDIVSLGDGRVSVSAYEEQGMVLKPIDFAAKAWGQSIELPYNVWNVYSGDAENLAYCSDSSNFYGINAETKEKNKLFNFINCDVDSNNINSTVPLPDGRILCTSYNYRNDTASSEIILLSKKPASEIEPKTVLTYACMYLDYNMRGEIINFNKTNGTYRIEVQDYSEYNTQDDYNAGLTKLTTEIISGKIPDLLATDSLPIKQYGAKGLLEDLWQYIDADPELGRENLVEHVFEVMQQDGKLYHVGPRFDVSTVIGSSNIVGTEPGWTVDEMFAALEKMPEGAMVFDQYVTRDDILMYSLYLGMDSYVNWNTGECSFDSQGFIKLLEFANSFQPEFDWENYDYELDYESEYSRITNGKQMLVLTSLSDFDYVQMYIKMFGGDVTFIGFPTESGNGSAIQMSAGIAMTTKCADKQGAWEFIRLFLMQDYQQNNMWWGLPTNKNAFDAKLEEAMKAEYYTDPETGEEVEQSKGGWGWGDGEDIEIFAMTQEEADMITGLINSTTATLNYDQSMYDIIMEEAGAYFSGQKPAKDVAAIIQSKINLYVNEQR